LIDPAYALAAAFFWALSPIYYRGFLAKFDVLSFNFLRTSSAAAALAIPAIIFWSSAGLGYAVLSGAITLTLGDSLFLLSIRETGASVAAPVVYTYVLMIQAVGVGLGQSIPYSNFAAALMVVAGVFILSRGGGGRPRAKGITFALSAAVLWSVGQELIQAATNAGGSTVPVTFTRNLAAAVAMGIAFLLTRKSRTWPRGLGLKGYGVVLLFVLSDLVVGSLLFVYSISIIGVALTVILTSLSPLLTQILAKALGKESPSPMDYLGGVLVVSALVLAVAL
jgi:drug/metabolite transporter, DME family